MSINGMFFRPHSQMLQLHVPCCGFLGKTYTIVNEWVWNHRVCQTFASTDKQELRERRHKMFKIDDILSNENVPDFVLLILAHHYRTFELDYPY